MVTGQQSYSNSVHRAMTEVDESMILGRASTMISDAPQTVLQPASVLKEAIQSYRREMSKKAMAQLPMDEDALYEIHKAAKESGMDVLSELNMDERDPVLVDCRREYNAKVDEIYEEVASENKVAIQQQCVCTVC
ncbi:unnamed protein product [Prorocentrum cordatum]|uniref:Uncharacterized protein n=1 Tax=Prorocentrum cordatum TaxID=2364126 RepID=A0ABN9S2V5_9DINO|nr:unnamed protein product [Polarella glacialis]